jgi:GTP-sensing pleiotropic transcriptional regulator CodY
MAHHAEKAARIEKEQREREERRTRAIASLAICLGRSEVMRVHHDEFIRELDRRGGDGCHR